MRKRSYRNPRQGEIAVWLSSRAKEVKKMGNLTGDGEELRVRPSRCCGHDKEKNPSTQINEKNGLWRCFRCGKTGNWFTFTSMWGSPIPENDRYEGDHKPIDPSFIQKMFGIERKPVTRGHCPELLTYLSTRGIKPETADAYRVSTKGCNVLRWPIYGVVDNKWQVVNARLRLCLNKEKATVTDWFEQRGGETGLLLGNHLLDLKDPEKRILITEGQWDAMTAYQLGFKNSFSLPNGASHVDVNSFLRYIPHDWEVWLSMDMDEAGNKAVEKFYHQLGGENLVKLNLPYKDLNEWLIEEPNLTKEMVESTAYSFSRGDLNKDPQEFLKIDLDKEDEEVKSKIVGHFPWERLNRLFAGGLYGGQTTGLLAPSGVGKSTFCNQIVAYNCGRSVKTGIISLEGSREEFASKIRAPIKGQWEKKYWPVVVENLLVSKLQGKKTTFQECYQEFSRMIKEGAKLLVIDNLDFIDRGDKREAYDQLIELAVDNGVHIIVVWQPNKINRETIVNSGNQKGYSTSLQDADNYINLNVIDDYVRIEVEKTRQEGVSRINNNLWLVYHKEIRCFEEAKDIKIENNQAGKSEKVIDLFVHKK